MFYNPPNNVVIMPNINKKDTLHLNDSQIILIVDKIMSKNNNDISEKWRQHMGNCLECKIKIMKLQYYYEN